MNYKKVPKSKLTNGVKERKVTEDDYVPVRKLPVKPKKDKKMLKKISTFIIKNILPATADAIRDIVDIKAEIDYDGDKRIITATGKLIVCDEVIKTVSIKKQI